MKKLLYFSVLFLGIFVQFLPGNSLQAQGLVLVPDTIVLTPLIPKTVNILANDIIPAGDSVVIVSAGSSGYIQGTIQNGGFVTFVANYTGNQWGYYPVVVGGYRVHDFTLDTFASAHLVFRIRDYSYDSLTVNNINARFQADGSHFFGPDHARFEVPKNSGKNTIYCSDIWIGGMDQDSVLHLAAEMYGQGPQGGTPHSHRDFFAGPVSDSAGYSIYQDTLWNYVWNLSRDQIEYHKTHWFVPGYLPIHDILTWPGNGDTGIGQAARLAPFFDRNNDGIYNPMEGDYPLIRGDQALFFIFNDDRNNHTETDGIKMKVEVQGMAYAFNLSHDSAFWNTVFLNYKVINRSQKIYYHTFLGTFTDLDIGWYMDDYIGSDVERGLYYGYNGTPIDGSGQPEAYGAHPPAQSVTFLGGPIMDPDGVDNPKFDNYDHQLCNESINGLHFGDSIVDNERLGMSHFYSWNNSGIITQGPSSALDYYNYMKGKGWKCDSTPVRFFYPGQSDTLNWGTGCTPASCSHLSETLAGNSPGDRRGMGSIGPFTFNPGQVEELDVAFTFARDYDGTYPGGSVGKLGVYTDSIRKHFISNVLPDGSSFNGIGQTNGRNNLQIKIFPNPASSLVNIRFEGEIAEPVTIRIINASGNVVSVENRIPVNHAITLDITGLSSGLYFISIETKNQRITKKISVIR